MDFELAAVAGAGVDFPDRQAATEAMSGGGIEAAGEFGERCFVGLRGRFGQGSVKDALQEEFSHGRGYRSWPE
jgi:hypothetical protein